MNTPTGTPASTAVGAVVFSAVTPGGRRRPLAVRHRTEVLRDAYAGTDPTDRSVRSFARHVSLREITVAEDTTADVDTWDDVRGSDLD